MIIAAIIIGFILVSLWYCAMLLWAVNILYRERAFFGHSYAFSLVELLSWGFLGCLSLGVVLILRDLRLLYLIDMRLKQSDIEPDDVAPRVKLLAIQKPEVPEWEQSWHIIHGYEQEWVDRYMLYYDKTTVTTSSAHLWQSLASVQPVYQQMYICHAVVADNRGVFDEKLKEKEA